MPLDFSNCSARVAFEARTRAAAADARLVFLHALQLPSGIGADVLVEPSPGHRVKLGDHLEKKARDLVFEFVRQAREEGITAEGWVEAGEPAEVILAEAERRGAKTIIMGSHGRKGLAKLLLGSVSQKVAKARGPDVVRVQSVHHPDCEAGSCNWCTDAGLFREKQDLALVPEMSDDG